MDVVCDEPTNCISACTKWLSKVLACTPRSGTDWQLAEDHIVLDARPQTQHTSRWECGTCKVRLPSARPYYVC